MFILLVILYSFRPTPASAAPLPPPLKACIDERPWAPFTNPDTAHPGSMQILISAVAKDVKLQIDYESFPWRRCLEEVRAGRMDALVGAAYVPFIAQLAAFPMLNGEPDPKRALGKAPVLLVKRKDSPVDWDGKHFFNLRRPVGTAAGTQVMIAAVKEHGGAVDPGGRTDERNLTKLLAHKIDLVAAYQEDLEPLIKGAYRGKVTVLPVPLVDTYYYLAFSKPFAAKYGDLVESLWDKAH